MLTLTVVASVLWAKLRKRSSVRLGLREWVVVVSLDLPTFYAGFVVGGAV